MVACRVHMGTVAVSYPGVGRFRRAETGTWGRATGARVGPLFICPASLVQPHLHDPRALPRLPPCVVIRPFFGHSSGPAKNGRTMPGTKSARTWLAGAAALVLAGALGAAPLPKAWTNWRYSRAIEIAATYDLAQRISKDQEDAAEAAQLGAEEENSSYTDPRPWIVRNQYVIWIAAGIALLLVAYPAIRVLRGQTRPAG